MKKSELNQNIKISEGNFVLKNTDEVGFMVFDLPACYCCPYATEWCKKYCYAKAPQDMFKDSVLRTRMSNFEESRKETFVKDMIDIIEFNLDRRKYKSKEKVYFRFHGSGDIYNEDYFKNIIAITDYFRDNEKIVFQTYTKSLPIISKFDLSDINIKIMFSIVEDTKESDIQWARELGLSMFNAVPQTDNIDGYICKGDCSKCQTCYEKNDIQMIYVETHGSRLKRSNGDTNATRVENSVKNYKNNNISKRV